MTATHVHRDPFAPVVRRTVAEEVRDRIRRSIEVGDLAPGAPLPSERTLCDEFAVARTSVREAIQGLVSQGVVERRGNRTRVVEHVPGVDLARADRARELFEVRRLIELPVAELAAVRARPDQRAELAASAAGLDDALPPAQLPGRVRAFLAVLARCSGNVALAELHGKVLDALDEADGPAFTWAAADEPDDAAIVAAVAAHVHATAAAVAAGDPVGAVRAVEHHLQWIEDRVLRGSA